MSKMSSVVEESIPVFIETDLRGRMELSGLNVQVVGLGLTGRSVSSFLARRGANVTATDLRPIEDIEEAKELVDLGVTVLGGGRDVRAARGIDLIIISPGVAPDIPLLVEARGKGVEIISDIELASRFMTEQVLAVAGTNGKTTTATLLGKVFEDAGREVFVGGNIGTPVLDSVEASEPPDFSVLEVSSFQLEGINSFSPHVAMLLNITEDHLDRYEDFNDYAETKFRLFMNQQESDFAIVNMDDPAINERVAKEKINARLLALMPLSSAIKGDGLYLSGDEIIFTLDGRVESYPTEGFALIGRASGKRPGKNSVENIMAAVACARLMGIERERIIESINSFTGLAHRMEFVREVDKVTYINDSKATNPASVVRALEGLEPPVVLIAGGKEKGCDYGVLEAGVKEKVRVAVLCGEAGKEINKSLSGVIDTVLVGSFDEAVEVAHKRAEEGETVILSPACSSFDEFKSYTERGERFKALVEEF